MTATTGGTCTLEVPFHEEFLRPGDVVRGPVFMAAADAVVWLAIATRSGPKRSTARSPHVQQRERLVVDEPVARQCGAAGEA